MTDRQQDRTPHPEVGTTPSPYDGPTVPLVAQIVDLFGAKRHAEGRHHIGARKNQWRVGHITDSGRFHRTVR